MLTGVLKSAERKGVGENWINANFNIRKMHSNVQRMDDCKYSKKQL